MKACVLALSSITYAMKAKHILEQSNIQIRIVKLETYQTKSGCAYGIEFDCEQRRRATESLSNHGIPFSEILR